MRHGYHFAPVFMCILVLGLSFKVCAEDRHKKTSEVDETMKGNSCAQRLAIKKELLKELNCEINKEDADCKDLVHALEELERQCGGDVSGK